MAKIRFRGERRETFSWTNMGKANSYSFGPNEVREVADKDLPYLLSFGNFSALEEEIAVAVPANASVVETKKVDPFISVTPVVTEPVVVPVTVPVVEPVVVPVEVAAPVEVVEEQDKVDYTSFSKRELVKLCKERKLETIGNRDDLICRLVSFDNEK